MKAPANQEISIDQQQRWQAIVERDHAFADAFVFGVTSTGIYCRPGCPARRPAQQNIRYFDDCAAAEAAGFRACKRCQPRAESRQARRQRLAEHACRIIEQADETPSLEALAAQLEVSASHLHRVFKEIVGITPAAYTRSLRQNAARRALSDGVSVTDSAYAAGYGSAARFYEDAKHGLGMHASTRRAKGRGERIHYAIGDSSLGKLLVAATAKGICEVSFGDTVEEVLEKLMATFPAAEMEEAGPEFTRTIAEVVALVETPSDGCTLPLDIRGTAFQRRVWDALRDIPLGQTANYGDIADAIGAPKAARAVAGACAANPIGVIVPCHRVIHKDGTISGYASGVERKRVLLEREGVSLPADNKPEPRS